MINCTELTIGKDSKWIAVTKEVEVHDKVCSLPWAKDSKV